MIKNPYLEQMGAAITSTANQNLQRNLLPAINRNAAAMGGYGDSRQGIAQGIAMGDTQMGITNSLANMYGNLYEQDQNRTLQRYGIDTNAAVQREGFGVQRYGIDKNAEIARASQELQRYGIDQNTANTLAGLATQRYGIDQNAATAREGFGVQRYGIDQNANVATRGQDQNFYTAQRGQDLQQQGQQFNQYLGALSALTGMGAGMSNIGMQQQQAGAFPYQMMGNLLNPYLQNGTTTTTGNPFGGGIAGAIGGGLTAAQLLKLLGG